MLLILKYNFSRFHTMKLMLDYTTRLGSLKKAQTPGATCQNSILSSSMVLLQRRPPKFISILLLIVVWGCLLACGSKNTATQEDNASTKKTGEKNTANQENKTQEILTRKMLAPQDLVTFLPKTVEGYLLDGQISGDTATIKNLKVTNAEAVYKKGANILAIVLTDYSEAPQVYSGISTVWKMGLNMDNAQEKISPVTIKKQQGMARFNKKNKTAEVVIGIGNRFIVTIKADNQKDATLVESVAESLDFENLLKKK